jgi:crotonobetainyl-CoA:carnitine CoA-transferase CaiB-like acyl-CoA transferase
MTDGQEATAQGPLVGLRVLDTATLFAGPMAASVLGDLGADVIKVEHPRMGDPLRGHGHGVDGVSLWWKVLSRNKRTLSLLLSDGAGRDLFLELIRTSDVLIENFRPGTLERWGLGPDVLHEANPGLIVARVTGFGQSGPMAHRPGFGTLAESMSGFAHITGEADGPPTLPPFGLADGIAALATAVAVLAAVQERERSGLGQVVDLAIIEPILAVLGPQVTVFDRLGVVQGRTGNRSFNNAPRNLYRTKDDRWVGISTSAQTIAERVVRLVGREDMIAEPWFASGRGRADHVEELDAAVGGYIAARTAEEVTREFDAVGAAVAPVMDASDIAADPQYAALKTFVRHEDDEVGPLLLQNVMFRMSRTPGAVRWPGRALGADTDEILGELGVDGKAIAQLREDGVV